MAQNIALALAGRPPKPFSFETIGLLASIGRRTGVGRILGFNFSGFFAWWLWRTIYLSKLPGLDKKVRVAFDWTLDLLFRKDICAIHDLPLRANSMRCGLERSWSGSRSSSSMMISTPAILSQLNEHDSRVKTKDKMSALDWPNQFTSKINLLPTGNKTTH